MASRSKSPPEKRRRLEKKAEDAAAEDAGKGSTEKGISYIDPGARGVTEADVLRGTTEFSRRTSDKQFDPKEMMKFICWNVAGLRGILAKGTALQKLVEKEKPDVLCINETKLSDIAEAPSIGVIPGYTFVDTISTVKKGYAGVRTYVKDSVKYDAIYGLDLTTPDHHEPEGRVATVILKETGIACVNSYVPNSGMELDRLDFRVGTFDAKMRTLLSSLCAQPSAQVIWTGDLNTAERDYDRFFASDWQAMQKCAGFAPQERASFRRTLKETKMVDAFRALYPTAARTYTFWSYRFNQRAKNNGWRLDYFVVSAALARRIVDCFPLPSYMGSDHCPLCLWLSR